MFKIYFLVLVSKYTITIMTAITMKIPNPIPALKMPAIALQELNREDTINNNGSVKRFIFVMVFLIQVIFINKL